MAIPHECRLYKHVGPDGIPYALVVARDMFTIQELLEKIWAILRASIVCYRTWMQIILTYFFANLTYVQA